MNEKGYGFKDFMLIFGIIFILFLIVIVIYQVSFKKGKATDPIDPKEEEMETVSTYPELEKKLKIAAERYQNDNYHGSFEGSETWILSYNLLLKKKYLKKPLMDVNDSEKECSGYVVFKKNGSNITYEPYLKCENYTTDGYNSSDDEI